MGTAMQQDRGVPEDWPGIAHLRKSDESSRRRAMRAHDEEREQWWPIGQGPQPERQTSPELLYAMLGPHLTQRLITLHDDAVDAGVDPGIEVGALIEGLRWLDGRCPDQLVLAAAAMAHALAGHDFLDGANADRLAEVVSLTEVYKHHGLPLIFAIEQFGFTVETFVEYVRTQWRLRAGIWPPAGAAYTQEPPGSDRPRPEDP